jgi:hypothetical protein
VIPASLLLKVAFMGNYSRGVQGKCQEGCGENQNLTTEARRRRGYLVVGIWYLIFRARMQMFLLAVTVSSGSRALIPAAAEAIHFNSSFVTPSCGRVTKSLGFGIRFNDHTKYQPPNTPLLHASVVRFWFCML